MDQPFFYGLENRLERSDVTCSGAHKMPSGQAEIEVKCLCLQNVYSHETAEV